MLALVRPGSWNLPLFLHLLGAIALVGALIAVTLLAVEALRRAPLRPLLLRLALRTHLAVAVPGWVLMRVAGQWLESKEGPGSPTWLSVGFGVADGGAAVLIVLAVLLWFAARRATGSRPPATARIVAVLAPLYLAALAVAVWAMAAKPD